MMASEAEEYQRDYSQGSLKQRLVIVLHLTSIPFNFDMKNLPRFDKTIFSACQSSWKLFLMPITEMTDLIEASQ